MHSNPFLPKLEAIYAGATFAMRTNSYFPQQEAICAEHPRFPRSLVFPEAGSKLCTVAPFCRSWKQFYARYPFFPRTGSKLCRRKTASGMAAAWLATAPHQDQESELVEGSK